MKDVASIINVVQQKVSKQRPLGRRLQTVGDAVIALAQKVHGGASGTDVASDLVKAAAALNDIALDHRPVRDVEMNDEQFKAHVEREIEIAVKSQDTGRLDLLQKNIETFAETDADTFVAKVFDVGPESRSDFDARLESLAGNVASLKSDGDDDSDDDGQPEPATDDTGDADGDAADDGADAGDASDDGDAGGDDAGDDAGDGETETAKGDVAWPLDMNALRKSDSPAEKWGRVEKADVDFGRDGDPASAEA